MAPQNHLQRSTSEDELKVSKGVLLVDEKVTPTTAVTTIFDELEVGAWRNDDSSVTCDSGLIIKDKDVSSGKTSSGQSFHQARLKLNILLPKSDDEDDLDLQEEK